MQERYTRLKRLVRFNYLKILRLKTTAHQLAMGIAVGVFAGCLPALPPVPGQVLAAVIFAFLLRGSTVAAVILINHSNPLNWWIYWWIQYQVGKHLVPFDIVFDPANMSLEDFLAVGWQASLTLMVGGAVIGVPMGVATYFISKPLISAYRRRRALRMLKKRTSL
jgi:hypothetical protein